MQQVQLQQPTSLVPADPLGATRYEYFSHPCPRCGFQKSIKTAGRPPHYAALRCASCDRFIKWLAKPKSGQGGAA